MADDQEKTEEPTGKKIEDARKEGNVPKSQDASSFVTLIVAIGTFLALFPFIKERMFHLYRFTTAYVGTDIDKNDVHVIMITLFKEVALMVIPLASAVALSGILAAVMQFGFVYTTKPLIPDFKKINPIKGLKNMLSLKKLIEAIKTIVKVFAVFFVAATFLYDFIQELPSLVLTNMFVELAWLREKALILVAVMLMLFLVLAFVDLMFVRYNYNKDLKMSLQEIKDEHKSMEGDPQVKGRIRKVQMEMARKRMMTDIPSADVVITNPTHYAVAIRYDTKKENAPKVVGKGIDHLALKIKEIAREHNVQIVENKPLARALYKECEVDETIPETMYKAVAEVLAFVYKSSNKSRG